MYRVEMFIEDEWYVYGIYENRNKANEVAMQVRDQRECQVYVSKVDYSINGDK